MKKGFVSYAHEAFFMTYQQPPPWKKPSIFVKNTDQIFES